MVNVSQGGTKYLVPLLYFLTRLSGNRFVFHPFGGSLYEEYQKYSFFQKWIFRKSVLNAELFVPETRELYERYKNKARNIFWLPNTRPDPIGHAPDPHPFRKRFIFLGHLKKSKGVDFLLQAQKELDDDYVIDIYGSAEEVGYQSWKPGSPSVYKGVLEKSEVIATLQTYDVLVLPTWYYGEGHPGAILEAYSLGLPVISTRWRAIPEIVDHGETGLLIEPQSLEELLTAVQSFNAENYHAFSRAARLKYEKEFKTSVVNEKLFQTITSL